MRRTLHFSAGLLSALISATAGAQTASFQGLGDLSGGSTQSEAHSVSADGSVVAGTSASSNGEETFRWTSAGGMVGLGVLGPVGPGPAASNAMPPGSDRRGGVSPGGDVVVGASRPPGGDEQAFRWTQAGGLDGLGFLNPDSRFSSAVATSDAGAVVVGVSNHPTEGETAFRWTQASGMVLLSPGNRALSATGISADGNVVVGRDFDQGQAYRWVGGTLTRLSFLPGGSSSRANGVSSDGNVVVGASGSSSGTQAFRWTDPGGMTGLGDLNGGGFFSEAFAVSGDGDVVVGSGSTASGSEAFIWTQADGMRNLRDLLISHGVVMTGWTLTVATGVSSDGHAIVGIGINPQGQTEGWRATVPVGHRWIDPTGGSWDVATNWEPATVPGASDRVRFDLDAVYTVTGGASFGAATARAMGADDGTVDFDVGGLVLASPSVDLPSLTASFDATAKIIAGTSTFVHGVVGFGSNAPGDTTTTARLQVFNAGTQLTGSGTLIVGGADGGRGEVFVAAGNLRTIGVVLGVGAIGEGVVGNEGIWTVDNVLFAGFTHIGRLVVEEGGGVTAGRLEIGFATDPGSPASRVDVEGFGTVERSRLFVADSLLVGGTGPGTLRVRRGADVTAGHLSVGAEGLVEAVVVIEEGDNASGFQAELNATSVTIGRPGAAAAGVEVRPGGALATQRLVVGTGSGFGTLHVAGGTAFSERTGFTGDCLIGNVAPAALGGSVTVTSGGRLVCDLATVGGVAAPSSGGRVFVGANGGASTASEFVIARTLRVAAEGTLELAAGVVDAVYADASPPADPFDVVVSPSGRIIGSGTIVGSVDDGGTIIPGGVVIVPANRMPDAGSVADGAAIGGSAGGTLQVNGRVSIRAEGSLAIPLFGADTTQQGRLRVVPAHGIDGSAALAGTLRLDFSNGYAPSTGDTFLLLDAASTTGSFATTQVTGLEPGWQFEVQIVGGTVVLHSLNDGVPTTPAEPGAPRSASLVLHPPAPNPTGAETTLRFDLPAAGHVRLTVYDALGREVAVLTDAVRPAGVHEVVLQAGRLAPGGYVTRLRAGGEETVRILTVSR